DDLFLLADKNLECRRYHSETDGANWEQCTLRSWLNGYDAKSNKANQDFTSENFISSAFSSKEKEAIKQTNLMTDTGGVELEYLMNLKGKMIETSD
ncbi:MAG: hypothetical protein IJ733_05530, partial [Lachnospiraceae bacterium]|nr:hypothetical protein [Lachnospiraceae bacterium]